MTPPRRRRRLSIAQSAGVWMLVALLAWIDRDGCLLATRADVFSFLLAALGFIENAVEFVISGVEVTLSAAVTWLIGSVGWLVARVGDIVVSTGSIFAKTWDGLKALWANVVEPVVWELDALIARFYRWLQNLLAPVLEWARAVRDELVGLYRAFVAPILNALRTAQAILDVLAKLHVPFAAALDQYTSELETWISSEYLKVLGWVNRFIDTLNNLVTLDGLLQRFVLLRSIERDWYLVQRALVNPMFGKLTEKQSYRLTVAWKPQPATDLHAQLGDYLDGGSNDSGDVIDAAVAAGTDYWDSFDDSQAA